MGTPDLDKICNIAGYPIYNWTAEQLNVRARRGGGQGKRTDDDLIYLANNGAWFRVISSIDLNRSATDIDGGLTKHVAGLMPNPFTDISKEKLAKNFILYGGTSTWAGGSMGLRSGIESGGAYNMLGNNEVQDFGYKPMPGITSVTVETLGRLGVLKQATVKFKVWDKQQLDLMDVLYFRLGYSLILEWGQAKYFDNKEKLQSSEQFMLDPFSDTCKTPEDILIQMNINAQKSYGNYGGMFGVITNFDFSYTQEGGYDCTVKVLSMGAVFGNMPINRPSILSKVYEIRLDKFLNDEKLKKIQQERDRIEKEKLDALDKLNKALKPRKWAEELRLNSERFDSDPQKMDPKLPDAPIATLIYNTHNLGDLDVIQTQLAARQYVYTLSTEGYTVPDIVKKYEQENNITYSNYLSKKELTPYTPDGLVLKLGEIPMSSIYQPGNNYWMKDNGEGKIIYYQRFLKYITSGKDITVTLDVDRIKKIIADAKQDDLFSVITKKYIVYGGIDYGSTFTKPGYRFTIRYTYPVGSTPNVIFGDPNTRYNIIKIGDRNSLDEDLLNVLDSTTPYIKLAAVNNPEYIVELGGSTESLPDLNPFSIFTADLNLINSIEYPPGFIDLTKNQEYEEYVPKANAIRKGAQEQLEDVQKRLEVEINDLKKTLEASSAIELMLKTILLYGITYKAENEENFIKNLIKPLFSEGAYSKFFSDGYPTDMGLPKDDLFTKYTTGGLTKEQRLKLNLLYGNNYQLMSCENIIGSDGTVRDLLKEKKIPKVDFSDLCRVIILDYGETPQLGNSTLFESEELKKSVYINLGFFLLMLNHTAVLYSSDKKDSDEMIPLSYIDFNPGTNFYLSSINQLSINPYKFLIGYYGTVNDYKKLFDKSIINDEQNVIEIQTEEVDPQTGEVRKVPYSQPVLFYPETHDEITYLLPKSQKKDLKNTENPYVGRLMNVNVNVNYLLKIIKQYATNNNTHEVYFQTVIERVLDDLYKSLGAYNAFTLSYNDNSNCYHITDDQIQPADPDLISEHKNMIYKNAYEIPMYTTDSKTSIVRAFDIKTDISNRISSMIAISANPTVDTQVGLGKDSSDFGIYNLGTEDRYKRYVKDSKTIGPEKEIKDNGQMAEIAANFNRVVKNIYSTRGGKNLTTDKSNLTEDEIDRATNYYIERMSYIKNEQSGSVHSLVIPIKSSITMDGISSLYPFQLYTLPELLMPYRYSVSNLGKKVGFSITKLVHTFEGSQWTTQFDGIMTLLKEPSYYRTSNKLRKAVKPAAIDQASLNQKSVDTTKFPQLTKEFIAALDLMCDRLGCKRDDMLRVMYAESKFNPKAIGPKDEIGNPAYGLVQFTAPTYPNIGVRSYTEIPSDALKQLPYVEKYFNAISPKRTSYVNLFELYGAVFLPALITPSNLQNDSLVLQSKDKSAKKISEQNKAIAEAAGKKPGDSLTIGDFKKYVITISYNI